MTDKPLSGARVVSFESRHDSEMARLVEKLGGSPLSAPTLREVPLSDQSAAQQFADVLLSGACDVLVLMTGVGTQTLLEAMCLVQPREALLAALTKTDLVCRGPKPVKVLRGLGLTPKLVAPEPNTSTELLAEIEKGLNVAGRNVYVQEYGAPSPELNGGLERLGARVHRVPVYAWQLPADLEPLRTAISELAAGQVQVALFTSARQVEHLLQIAEQMGKKQAMLQSFERVVVASVGPVTTEALRAHGLRVDTEPEHPKMGQLVTHVAREWKALASAKAAQTQPN
jgi:uroporphyrinogen-III synthase